MAQTATKNSSGSNSRLALAAALVAMFVVGFNTTAVMTALPAIKSSLDMDAQALQWVMNIYMLVGAMLIAVMGSFSDIFGKMRVLVIGLMVFAVGSTINMFAGDGLMMLAGRACQGIGAASITGTSIAVVSISTPEENRAQALGLWSGVLAFAFGVGPLIGGVLTDSISWRGIFACDIVLLATALFLLFRMEEEKPIPRDLKPGTKIDYWGVAMLMVAMGTFVYGLTSGNSAGWTSPRTLVLFAVAVIFAIGFAYNELRVSEPLVDFGFFRTPRYVAAAIGMFFATYVLMGVIYSYNLFVQAPGALGLTPIEAGLTLLPLTMAMFILSLAAPRFLGPYSYHWPVTIGMLMLAAGTWLMHYTGNQTPFADFWWKLAILGVGLGLTYPLLPRVGLRALPDKNAGQGSGVINTCLYLGATVGVVASGIVTAEVRHSALASAVGKLALAPSDHSAIDRALAHGSPSDVQRALAHFSPGDAEKIKAAMQDVLDNVFTGVMEMMAVVALMGAVVVFFLIRGAVPKTSS